jgi:hypothetical protein
MARAEHDVRLYPHAFRSAEAGCANTTDSQASMTVEGRTTYRTGENGRTVFSYPADEVRCGRVEVGLILKDAEGRDSLLSWRVIDSGVNCTLEPPAPPSPPSPPTPPGAPSTDCSTGLRLQRPSIMMGPGTATATFTIAPHHADITVSLVSYSYQVAGQMLPQKFYAGTRGTFSAGGPYTLTVAAPGQGQVDLYCGDFQEEDLTTTTFPGYNARVKDYRYYDFAAGIWR